MKICDRHDEYEVPLIWTFAFSGCEYWCPYCGNKGGMMGTGHAGTAWGMMGGGWRHSNGAYGMAFTFTTA